MLISRLGSSCANCTWTANQPWVYEPDALNICTFREATRRGPDLVNDSALSLYTKLYATVICPGTKSPTMAPTTSPVTMAPTSAPTATTCSVCAGGTAGICRYLGPNASYGSCYNPTGEPKLIGATQTGATQNSHSGSNCRNISSDEEFEEYDNWIDAEYQLCGDSVERCTPENNAAFEAESSMAAFNNNGDFPQLCRAPQYFGAGGYTMGITPPEGPSRTLLHMEGAFPTFSTYIDVNSTQDDAWREAVHTCLGHCCATSQWCVSAYVDILSDSSLRCNLLSSTEHMVADSVNFTDLNCDIYGNNDCSKPGVALGDGAISGDWNFTYGSVSFYNNCDGRARKSGAGDVLDVTGFSVPEGFTLSNVTFRTYLEHCDVITDSCNYEMFQARPRRYFFRFQEHPIRCYDLNLILFIYLTIRSYFNPSP